MHQTIFLALGYNGYVHSTFWVPISFSVQIFSKHETAFSFESCVAMLHQSYFKQLMKLLHFTNMTVFLLEPEK